MCQATIILRTALHSSSWNIIFENPNTPPPRPGAHFTSVLHHTSIALPIFMLFIFHFMMDMTTVDSSRVDASAEKMTTRSEGVSFFTEISL